MIITLNDEMVDEITVQNLLDALKCNQEMADELLANEENLETYETQDLADQLRICRHLEYVIAYFLTAEDFERRVGKKPPQ